MARPHHIVPGPGRPKGLKNQRTLHRQFTIRELIHKHFPGGRDGLIRRACMLAAGTTCKHCGGTDGDPQLLKVLLAYDSGAPPQEVKFSGTKEQPLVLKIVRENGHNGHGNGNGGGGS